MKEYTSYHFKAISFLWLILLQIGLCLASICYSVVEQAWALSVIIWSCLSLLILLHIYLLTVIRVKNGWLYYKTGFALYSIYMDKVKVIESNPTKKKYENKIIIYAKDGIHEFELFYDFEHDDLVYTRPNGKTVTIQLDATGVYDVLYENLSLRA